VRTRRRFALLLRAVVIGSVLFLGIHHLFLRPRPPSRRLRPVGQLMADRPSVAPAEQTLAWQAAALKKLPREKRKLFWRLARLENSYVPPLRFLRFLRSPRGEDALVRLRERQQREEERLRLELKKYREEGRSRELERKEKEYGEKRKFWREERKKLLEELKRKGEETRRERLEFLVERFSETGEVCPYPLAAELIRILPDTPGELQGPLLRTAACSRYREGAPLLVRYLKEKRVAAGARPEAYRFLAVQAGRSLVRDMTALWSGETGAGKKFLGEAIRAIVPGLNLPPGRDDELPPGGRLEALREPGTVSARYALRHLTLYWDQGEREAIRVVKELLASANRSPGFAEDALLSLSLSVRKETVEFLVPFTERTDLGIATAAARALRLFTGAPIPEPSLDALFDPERSAASVLAPYLKAGGAVISFRHLVEKAAEGSVPALRTLTARAEAGQFRTRRGRDVLARALLRFADLPPEARCALAYAAGHSLAKGTKSLDLLKKALLNEKDPEVRGHVLWAASRVAGENRLQFFTDLLLEADPARSLSREVCLLLTEGLPTAPAYSPQEVVGAFPSPQLLAGRPALRWRLALVLRFFPCAGTWERLKSLAADSVAEVRESAVYSAYSLAGRVPPEKPEELSSWRTLELVKGVIPEKYR